ncbi:MAG: serine/threonine-protein kinase [Polyangiaceae bacterium]
MREPPSTPKSGYLRVQALAMGGMAQVDVVVKRELGFERVYAMKRLLPHSRGDETFTQMFLDEARIAGRLRHANVVSVLDVGQDADGPFLVMDYVEGVPLQKLVQHHRDRGELLPLQLVLRIGIQIAEGLHAAHELVDRDGRPMGLVHRDVSPSNVLVGYDGIVRVTDFGIAKAIGQTTKTSTGIIKGKPGYLSPEQLRFETPDRRSDLFSLGVVLYELLALERLYAAGDELSGLRRILKEPPPDLGEVRDDVPPELVELGFELLAKNPEDRPATAREVAERLEAMLADRVAEEGLLDLAEHMDDALGERRRAEREKLDAKLRAVEDTPVDEEMAPPVAAVTPPTRHQGAIFAVAALLFGVGVGAFVLLRAPESASLEPVVSPTPPATVQLTIDSDPSGARVTVDGEVVGTTPARTTLARGERDIRLAIEKEGYEAVERRLVPQADQLVHVALSRVEPPSSEAKPSPASPPPLVQPRPTKAAPAPSGGLFRRFD